MASISLTAEIKTAKSEDVEDIYYVIGMCALNAKLIDDLLAEKKDANGDEFERFVRDAKDFESALAQHGLGITNSPGADQSITSERKSHVQATSASSGA